MIKGAFMMELGITTFAETTPHVGTGYVATHAERLREIVEEIKLADQVGLDVYVLGNITVKITPHRHLLLYSRLLRCKQRALS